MRRRTLLRGAGLLALPAGLAAGCGGGGDDPLGADPRGQIELALNTDGGLETRWAGDVTRSYHEMFPDARVVQGNAARMATAVQPRFAWGRPPDLINNGGPEPLDLVALAEDGRLQDLTELYDAPALDTPGRTVRETLLPGAAERYALNATVTACGLWYSAQLFAENGWTPPATWAEFTVLLERMKARGLTPYGYAGSGSAEHQTLVILTSAARIGGPEVLRDIDNLVPGAWTAEPVRRAAAAWAGIGARFCDPRYRRLRKADVQLLQNQFALGLYPSAASVESEQAAVTPPGFGYRVMPIPPVTPTDRLPAGTIWAAPAEPFVVAAGGGNPRGALEYLRHLVSRAGAQGITTTTRQLTTVAGATDGAGLPPGLTSAAALLTAAGPNLVFHRFDGWYPALVRAARSATNALMLRGATAEVFVTRMERAAAAIRADPATRRFSR